MTEVANCTGTDQEMDSVNIRKALYRCTHKCTQKNTSQISHSHSHYILITLNQAAQYIGKITSAPLF